MIRLLVFRLYVERLSVDRLLIDRLAKARLTITSLAKVILHITGLRETRKMLHITGLRPTILPMLLVARRFTGRWSKTGLADVQQMGAWLTDARLADAWLMEAHLTCVKSRLAAERRLGERGGIGTWKKAGRRSMAHDGWLEPF